MRTPPPGPPRACVNCGEDIPYPPAGLTPAQLGCREYRRALEGKPAEFCIAVLDADRKPASMCTLCAQARYREAQARYREAQAERAQRNG